MQPRSAFLCEENSHLKTLALSSCHFVKYLLQTMTAFYNFLDHEEHVIFMHVQYKRNQLTFEKLTQDLNV